MIKCVFCGSENVVKNGNRRCRTQNKQRYMCKSCNKSFIDDMEFSKIKGTPQIVTLSLDLYFKGISLRQIQDHLKQIYEFKVHHETVRRWIIRYTGLMSDYVDKFKIFGSKEWHVDEQMIKSKGKYIWLWNALDADSRFLIACSVTERREIGDARLIFKKAKELTIGDPETITTDGLWSYEKAINKEIPIRSYPRLIKHIRLVSMQDKINNNLIERYHSTFRSRDKVMRGTVSGIVNGYRLYYNFIRPHMSLDGQTPAQAAGIDLKLQDNRWLSLIRKSI